MRLLRSLDEIIIWLLIAFVAAINIAVFTGIVVGEDAIDTRTTFAAATDDSSGCEGDLDKPSGRAKAAECDDSADLPGRFVATQGRQHIEAGTRVPFCPEGQVSSLCYASNPPTSGMHLAVQRDYDLGDGNTINIPPDPGVYDFEVPREAIPHIEEHAGVFVGHNCSSAACRDIVERITDIVLQQVDEGARVVMSPDTDLAEDTIGLASWTRVDTFTAADSNDVRVQDFITTHSCRFDPEGFCEDAPDPRDRAAAPARQ